MAVEARHSAFLRNSRNQSPDPQAFETPLDPDDVYSLVAPYITSCPSSNVDLGFTAFPSMTTGSTYRRQGTTVTFQLPKTFKFPSTSTQLYCAWPLITGPIWKDATPDTKTKTVSCQIPNSSELGPAGQVYAILTTSSASLTDAVTIAGPAVVNVLAPYLA